MIKKLLATTLFFTTSGFALAQEASLQPEPTPMTVEELTESVTTLNEQLRQVSEIVGRNTTNIAALSDQQQTTNEKLQELSDSLMQMSSNQEAVATQIKDLTAQQQSIGETLAEAQAQISENQEVVNELSSQIGQIKTTQAEYAQQIREVNVQMDQISRGVGESRSLRFDNIQDESTLNDFRSLVDKTTPRQGTLTVENKMATGQYINVNRQQYFLSAGESGTFEVPVGNVSTQLRGQKVINWSIAAPDYKESIQIVPDRAPVQTTTLTMPPVVYRYRPVYVEPMTFTQFP